ncbi:MAG TPA: carboxymuconolactone decarboxylase family protein, partial [Ramlibacter sp.]
MPDASPLPQGYAHPGGERLPMPADAAMTPAQRTAAQALIDSPRKGVYGPFLPLLRSPVLLERTAKMGEYLRFESVLDARVRELATCAVARHVSNQFEWT